MSRVVLITGATGGIGSALANYFARKNDKLILFGKELTKLTSLQQSICSEHKLIDAMTPIVSQVDVRDVTQIKAAVESVIKSEEKIDILINNAGIYMEDTKDIVSPALQEMMQINFFGAVNLIKATVPYMEQKMHGIIINISSRAATFPRAHFGEYAATKAAMTAYSKSLSKRLSEYGIKVVSISPGVVKTPMSAASAVPDDKKMDTADIVAAVKFVTDLSPSAFVSDIVIDCKVDV